MEAQELRLNESDLKTLKKNIRGYSEQDGLADIAISILSIGGGLAIILNSFLLFRLIWPLLLLALLIGRYWVGKHKLGFVKPIHLSGTEWLKIAGVLMLPVLVGIWGLYQYKINNSPEPWQSYEFRVMLGCIGFMLASIWATDSFINRINRGYIYSVVTLTLGLVAPLLGQVLTSYLLIFLAVPPLIYGLVLYMKMLTHHKELSVYHE
ncbi:hypothetical protein KAR48_00180 [bacterium]|nr:hypothetical protein [bacterium]